MNENKSGKNKKMSFRDKWNSLENAPKYDSYKMAKIFYLDRVNEIDILKQEIKKFKRIAREALDALDDPDNPVSLGQNIIESILIGDEE